MSHTPFILASYLVGTAVLLWVAIAPVLHKRRVVRQLKSPVSQMDQQA